MGINFRRSSEGSKSDSNPSLCNQMLNAKPQTNYGITFNPENFSQEDVENPEQPDIHSSSVEYADRFSGASGNWMLERQKRSVLEILSKFEARTILELGGGHAQITPTLVEMGYEVTVRGSTPECATRLSSLLESNACSFSVGNIIRTEFPDNSFDVVICLRQISHLKHWKQLIREASRIARQVVVIDYPPSVGFNMLYGPLFPLKKMMEGNSRTYRRFNRKELRMAFGECGLRPDKSLPQFFLPMVMHRRLKNVKVSSALERTFSLLGCTRLLGSPIVASFVKAEMLLTLFI